MAGCAREPVESPTVPSASAAATVDSPQPVGIGAESWRAAQFGIYTTEPLPKEVFDDVVARAKRRLPGVDVVTSMDAPPPSESALLLLQPPIEELPAPTGFRFGQVARGIGPEHFYPIRDSRGILMFSLRLTNASDSKQLKALRELVGEIGTEQRGWIWTESARLLFAPDLWVEENGGWEGDLPDVEHHFSIRYHQLGDMWDQYSATNGRERAVTLGLAQLGLPDLVLSNLPPSQLEAAGVMLNACVQLLVEGARTDEKGRLEVDFAAIRHRGRREAAMAARVGSAKGRATIQLVPTEPRDGDPDNRLMEIVFPGLEGATALERQTSALEVLVGIVPSREIEDHEDMPDSDPD